MSSIINPTPDYCTDNWLAIGKADEIPVRGARRLLIDTTEIALFRTVDGAVFALRNACPHSGGPLSEGIIHGDCVTCPLHNWVISLSDGQAQGADEGCVETYPVHVEDNEVFVHIDSVVS